jgi:hypothetical protein
VYTTVEIPERNIVTWMVDLDTRIQVLNSKEHCVNVGTAFLSALEIVQSAPSASNWLRQAFTANRTPWYKFLRQPSLFSVVPDSRAVEDTVALAVPSIVIPDELNYVVSTRSRLFPFLNWSDPRPFLFDLRLLNVSLR